MAHSIFHFAFGVLVGTAVGLCGVIKGVRCRARVALSTAIMLLLAYGLGALAIMPNILHRMGYPDWFCRGWWMNICMLHPLIDRLRPGGMLIGEVIFVACVAFQYALLVYAVRVVEREQSV